MADVENPVISAAEEPAAEKPAAEEPAAEEAAAEELAAAQEAADNPEGNGTPEETQEEAAGGADEDISMYGGDALFVVLSEFFVSDKKKGSRNIADILEDIADSLKKISNKKK